MARIRTIKPSFFQSEDVSALPLRARLTWIGLWTHCDDQGRCKDNVRLIKAAVWPLDEGVSEQDIEEDLTVLAEQGRIQRYVVGGQRYLAIVNWGLHQKINRATPSRLPAPPRVSSGTSINSVNDHRGLTEDSRGEGKGKGREGKGRERARERAREAQSAASASWSLQQPPSPFCRRHPQGTDDPCRACQRAREAAETWHAEQRARAAAEPECPKPGHDGQLARNCSACASERKGAA